METTIDLTKVQEVWSWNGYNSRWVESFQDRDVAILEALDLIERNADELESVQVIEDDEYFTVVIKTAFDFYGWRESVTVYTTRPGVFVEDDEYNLAGEWRPAV